MIRRRDSLASPYRQRQLADRLARIDAVLGCLQRLGPLTSTQLARRLHVSPRALNQWMFAQRHRHRVWERMPDKTWLPLDEEPAA